jgi:hypothetical protein
MQGDTYCYTIKQIDDYLATTGLSGFALENERRRLIDRLAVRLSGTVDPESDVFSGLDKARSLMKAGFARYEKMIERMKAHREGNYDVEEYKAVPTPKAINDGFRDMAALLFDRGTEIHNAKFVYCSESIEMKFDSIPGLKFGIEIFYDTPDMMYVDATVDTTTKGYTANPGNTKFYVSEMPAYDVNSLTSYIDQHVKYWEER